MTYRDRQHRSNSDRMVAGVSGGLAEYFDVDVTLVRVGWVVLCFVTLGMALLGYIVLPLRHPNTDPSLSSAIAGARASTRPSASSSDSTALQSRNNIARP